MATNQTTTVNGFLNVIRTARGAFLTTIEGQTYAKARFMRTVSGERRRSAVLVPYTEVLRNALESDDVIVVEAQVQDIGTDSYLNVPLLKTEHVEVKYRSERGSYYARRQAQPELPF